MAHTALPAPPMPCKMASAAARPTGRQARSPPSRAAAATIVWDGGRGVGEAMMTVSNGESAAEGIGAEASPAPDGDLVGHAPRQPTQDEMRWFSRPAAPLRKPYSARMAARRGNRPSRR